MAYLLATEVAELLVFSLQISVSYQQSTIGFSVISPSDFVILSTFVIRASSFFHPLTAVCFIHPFI